jgi:hypothetical protein
LKEQVSQERENWEVDARWAHGETPEPTPGVRRGMEQRVIFEVPRKPQPPPAVPGMSENEKLIAKLNLLIEQLQREIRDLKTENQRLKAGR